MDAFAKNKAEAEFLKLFSEIASQLELDLEFELEALRTGGIKEFIKVLSKKRHQKIIIPILAFFLGIATNVISDVVSDYISVDKELQQLEKEEKKLNIRKLKKELESEATEEEVQVIINNISFYLVTTDKIILHRSKFYKAVTEEQRVYQLSTQEVDENNKPLSVEKVVKRSDFKKFIVDKIHVEPDEFDSVNVEVVAPVLKQGKMKWKGIFNGEPISFNMLDTAFKNDVLSGKVSFTSGTMITCSVQFEKEMDEDGEVKVKQINVFDVLEVLVGDTVTRTARSREQEETKKQYKMDLFKGGGKAEG